MKRQMIGLLLSVLLTDVNGGMCDDKKCCADKNCSVCMPGVYGAKCNIDYRY